MVVIGSDPHSSRRWMILFLIVLFAFIAIASWTNYWIMWTTLVIFLSMWLVVDFMFMDDSHFIFDPDTDNWRRQTDPKY